MTPPREVEVALESGSVLEFRHILQLILVCVQHHVIWIPDVAPGRRLDALPVVVLSGFALPALPAVSLEAVFVGSVTNLS